MPSKLRITISALTAMLTTLIVSGNALACDNSPDVSQLPGESATDVKTRETDTVRDWFVIQAFQVEESAFKEARTVYLGRVAGSTIRSKEPLIIAALVKPLVAAKGSLPKQARSVVQNYLGACLESGDGNASNAPVGTLVYVFEGLRKTSGRPRGIESIRATDARTFELIDLLFQFGIDQKEKGLGKSEEATQ